MTLILTEHVNNVARKLATMYPRYVLSSIRLSHNLDLSSYHGREKKPNGRCSYGCYSKKPVDPSKSSKETSVRRMVSVSLPSRLCD